MVNQRRAMTGGGKFYEAIGALNNFKDKNNTYQYFSSNKDSVLSPEELSLKTILCQVVTFKDGFAFFRAQVSVGFFLVDTRKYYARKNDKTFAT